MRKLIHQLLTTLDGYFEGPNREIGWHNVDEEFNEYAIDPLGKLDTLLFGRVTYASCRHTGQLIAADCIDANLNVSGRIMSDHQS